MTNTQITDNQNSAHTQDVAEEEMQSFAEEMGTLVFQSALMQYLADADTPTAEAFESYVDQNVATESFLDDLCDAYPDFEKLLKEEISLLQEEVKEIITDEDEEDEE